LALGSGLRSKLILLVASAALLGSRATGQSLSTQAPLTEPTFDVVSIKPDSSDDRGAHGGPQAGGRFTVTNVTVFRLIANAYRLHDAQVIGGPGWINSDRYDVVAVGPANVTAAQRARMLQKILDDRFALEVHHEMRVLPAANLVMARKDGTLGPHLHRATDADSDCTPLNSPPEFTNGMPACSLKIGTGMLRARGMTMQRLADTLGFTYRVAGFVFDETNLTGSFNIDALQFRPDDLPDNPPPNWPANAPWPSLDAPSIYTALQEQLGLKLEFIKEPVDVIVIDHVDRPTPN
jgi:uncharacterized protein (TIGR03435 family)